ncbi:uncharacterized protein LY89DRAFT_728741 [Mollisia scopiformis]|uniref:BTB domain-containing protein n=1 Tax=Mollisia scopiformis TaxID=149040 RepID=A0A194XRE0_MOLSC|nr:uncharacterized protein LY89DRAFT_728741 [Mollisia scopiformis]KUJ22619.1 hypothetical protein LY89DRAFT_728741 [Mollisia scopiformis]
MIVKYSDATSLVALRCDFGFNPKKFSVHKETISLYSPVLAKFFEDGSIPKTYVLNTGEGAATRLVQWLYSQKLIIHQLHKYCSEHCAAHRHKEDRDLVELWDLAERLEISPLQNLVIDSMEQIAQHCGCPPWTCILRAYQITTKDSKLQKYLVALCSNTFSRDKPEDYKGIPPAFYRDLAVYACGKLKLLNESEKAYDLENVYCDAEKEL